MADEATSEEIGADLLAVVSILHRRFRSRLSSAGVGEAATTVLLWLQRVGPRTLTDVCEHTGVSLGSMSQTIRRLEDLRYVDRTPDPNDRRRVLLAATPDGAAKALAVRQDMADHLSGILAGLDARDRRSLAAALPAFRRLAEATSLGDDPAP